MNEDDQWLTVVYRVKPGEGQEILRSREWSAASWSHVIRELRDTEIRLAFVAALDARATGEAP